MARTNLPVIFLLLYCFVTCHGINKRWVPNTNFANGNNWDTGKSPCGPVSVYIPESSPLIYIQMDTTIKEMFLPNNGELVLGDGMNLQFSDSDNPPCPNPATGEVNFIATAPQTWFDPTNWCASATVGGDCTNSALLDTEQVPCSFDDVIFPAENSYMVDLDTGLDITVGTLKVSSQSYTTQSFRRYLSTDFGRRSFPPPGNNPQSGVTVKGPRKCSDVTGCTCGNDATKIKEKICSFKSPKCPKAYCHTALTPNGSCCDMCGATLKITYGAGFKFDTLRDGIQRNYIDGKPNSNDVNYIVSKLSDGKIQMFLNDPAGNFSIPFARIIKKALDADVANGGIKYAVTSVTLQVSAGPFTPTPEPHTGGQLDGGQITGIVLGLVIAIVVVLFVAYFIYRRKTSGIALSEGLSIRSVGNTLQDKFRRFRKPVIEGGVSVSFTDPTNINATLRGFDNPMYGSSQQHVQYAGPINDVELPRMPSYDEQPRDSGRGFDNPLYDNKVSAFFNDPTDVGPSHKFVNPMYSSEGIEDDSTI